MRQGSGPTKGCPPRISRPQPVLALWPSSCLLAGVHTCIHHLNHVLGAEGGGLASAQVPWSSAPTKEHSGQHPDCTQACGFESGPAEPRLRRHPCTGLALLAHSVKAGGHLGHLQGSACEPGEGPAQRAPGLGAPECVVLCVLCVCVFFMAISTAGAGHDEAAGGSWE